MMAPLIDGERKDWEQVSKVSSDKKPIKYKLNPEILVSNMDGKRRK